MNYERLPIPEMAGFVLALSLFDGSIGLLSGAASFGAAFLLVAIIASAALWVFTWWYKP